MKNQNQNSHYLKIINIKNIEIKIKKNNIYKYLFIWIY